MKTLIHSLINSFYTSKDHIKYFETLNNSQKALILYSISEKFRVEILNRLTDIQITEIFKFLDLDEITDILQVLSRRRQNKIISKLNIKHKEKVNFLLKFAPDSAAGIMSLNYLIVTENTSKKEILSRLERHLALGKKEPTILVLDVTGNFLGEVRISNFLFEKKDGLFSKLKRLPHVIYNEDQEEVVDVFRKNSHERVVVLDDDGSILGIIHAKDVFKVIEEEDTEDYYALAGLDKQEDILDNAFEKVRFRLGWLIVNLATAFLAAWVVTFFEDTITKYVLLAAFMPIIAGMGGNAGTQTTAILIRSMALKKIDSKLTKQILGAETMAGIINGIIIGLLVAGIAYLFDSDLMFGVVAGLAIVLNLIIAAIFGVLVPLILKVVGYDPAASSSVFVTTATDVFGFFIFLGLASIMLM